MLAIQTPFAQFFDLDGKPLDSGKLYFGAANQNPETNPLTIYWDAAGTQPAAQPIRTLNGYPARNGTPGTLYIATDHSLTVRNKRGKLVVYAPSSAELGNDLALQANIDALRDDLASTADETVGAGMVGFDEANDYAANTIGGAVKQIQSDMVRGATANVLDYIPQEHHAAIKAGTSTYDCRIDIQAAIDSLGPRGGRLFIPRGTYEMGDSASRCLLVTCPIIMEGEGYFSCLKPKASVGALTSCIQYAPSPSIDCSQSSIRHLFIGDPNTGLRSGRYGIFIDTQVAGANLPELTVHDVFIGDSGDHAICHVNNATNNVNGGLYAATIDSCQLRGGIKLELSGDSINILRNILSGDAMGIDASIIAGASQLHIVGNNITSKKGAIRLARAARPLIMGNNIEQTVAGNTNDASMINLSGTAGLVVQPIIVGNNMGAFSGTGISRSIRCENGEGGLIQDNSFLPSVNTQYGIAVASGWSHLRVGWNQYGTDSLFRVSDNGIGTMGVARSFEGLLQNSWVPQAGNFGDCWYFKDHLGFVEIHGVIKSGTIGTLAVPVTLFTLPEDYRPARSEHFRCYSQDTVPAVVDAAMFITASTGVVSMIQGSNGMFTFNCRFMAAKPSLSDIRFGSGSNNYGYGPGHTSNL